MSRRSSTRRDPRGLPLSHAVVASLAAVCAMSVWALDDDFETTGVAIADLN